MHRRCDRTGERGYHGATRVNVHPRSSPAWDFMQAGVPMNGSRKMVIFIGEGFGSRRLAEMANRESFETRGQRNLKGLPGVREQFH